MLFAGGSIAGEARTPPLDYQIGTQPLADALQQWAQRSGQALLFDAAELSGLRSRGVQGRHAPDAALEQLLQGLPVKVLHGTPGVYVVRRQAAAPAPAAPRPSTPATPAVAAATGPASVALPTLQVTGSRLPRTSVQTTLPLAVIEREDILRSGHGSLYDLLRQLPGMNSHSPLSSARSGDSMYLPMGAAATTSLDGMGPRATLFLVNGRRLPRYPMVSLEQGALTDLGGIPLSFVERIELVRGGASAIYGADAISGVVNIILRDHADGPEAMLQTGTSSHGDGAQNRLQAATGGTTRSGDRWFIGADLLRAEHVAGHRRAWNANDSPYPIGLLTGNGYYVPAPLCGAPLRKDDDGCWFDSARARSLQPASTATALYARFRHEGEQGHYAYAEARASQTLQRLELGPTAVGLNLRNGMVINHVFQEAGSVRTRVRALEADLAVGLGRDQPGRHWEAGLSRQRSQVHLSTKGTVHSARLQDALREGFIPGFTELPPQLAAQLFPTIHNRGRTEQWQAWWGVQRDLFALPGGNAQLASGIDLRRETWTARPDALLGKGELALALPVEQRQLSRQSNAAYTELGLPLARSLRLDLAARWDRDGRYRDFSPRAGLRWTPSSSWSFLLSSGESYRAPSLFERRRPPAYFGMRTLRASPALPPCTLETAQGCMVDVQVAENPTLAAETARSHSLGASWTPNDALSLTLTHNVVELRNEILALRPEDASWESATWNLDGSGHLQGVRLSFDNLGRTVSRNWVLRGDYRIGQVDSGQWRFTVDALHQQELRRFRRNSTTMDLLGYSTPDTAGTLGVQWQDPRWDIALRANYRGSTLAWLPEQPCPAGQHDDGHCRNPDQLRWDLHLGRSFGPRFSAALDVHNLFDAQPVNYIPDNGTLVPGLDDPLGRYLRLTLTFR